MDPELWKNARKIGFIRNPFDWCNSIYNKGGIEVLNFDNKHGFTHFLETLDKTPYDWLTDENDNLVMDTVYKTEDLDPTIFKEYQIAVRYSNKSRKPRVEMSNKDIEIIREKFYREFKHYED